MATTSMSDGFVLTGAGPSFKTEICDKLSEMQLFADFAWPDLEALAGYLQCYQLKAGVTVFKEGQPGNYMCLLVSGRIEILKDTHAGEHIHLVEVSPGKAFGEMSIIDGEPRSATCRAVVDSELLLLTKDNYLRILKERPALAVQIVNRLSKLMSQRLRAVGGRLVEHLDHTE